MAGRRMMTALAAAVVAVGGAFTVIDRQGAASLSDELTDQELIELRALADAATVGIAGHGCDGFLRGSGFVSGDTTFTNRHLVEGSDLVKIDQLVDPVLVPLSAVSSDLDLAAAPGVDVVQLTFADQNPDIGAPVVVAGHAGGGVNQVVEGRVHLYADGAVWGVGGEVMLIDAPTEPGFSGGPVLNRDGEVVAMLQGWEPNLRLSLAIPVEELNAWDRTSVGDPDWCAAPLSP